MLFGAASTRQHQPADGHPIRLEYRERPGLLGLSIKNFLLNLITLSIYRFWAKTDVRRHVWSSIHVNGDPVEYTGTGKELFMGALIIFVVLVLPVIAIMFALQFIAGPEHPLTYTGQFMVILIGLLLWGMAIYRARRYRLSRTLWRGIRGGLSGSSSSFSLLYFGAMLLRGITMGWSTPAMNLTLQERLIGNMSLGNSPFRFSGRAGPLYSRYALCWFATPLVLLLAGIALLAVLGFGTSDLQQLGAAMEKAGDEDMGLVAILIPLGMIATGFAAYSILWTFYTAREMALFADYTTFDDATFSLNATAGSLIGLWLGNMMIVLLTLGIGQPYVVQRTMRYICDRLEVQGTVDISAIQQSSAALDKRGEGLLDAFDVDAF